MTDLLPCPFCGSPAALCVLEDEPGSPAGFWVNCSCGVETTERRTEAEAAERWNRRAVPSCVLGEPQGAPEPRPIDEYHEDMGPVLWWCYERQTVRCETCKGAGNIREPGLLSNYTCCPDCDGNGYCETGPAKLKGEPPYVGTPNDVGFTVEADIFITLRTHAEPAGVDGTAKVRRDVGGWPGYHTHFTTIATPSLSRPHHSQLNQEKDHD